LLGFLVNRRRLSPTNHSRIMTRGERVVESIETRVVGRLG